MDKPSTIHFSPFLTDGTDTANSKSGIKSNGFHKEPIAGPNCAKLSQKTTNGVNRNSNKDAAGFPPVLSTPIDLENTNILDTILVGQVEAPHTGTIKIIQLRRPQTKNALSRQMVRELGSEIEEIHRQTNDSSASSTRALILASAVDNVFCSGADLKERATMSLPETKAFLSSLRSLLYRLSTLPVPTVACVSGVALGGGFELALACHLRVFARNAAVGLPETRLAIIPGAGGTYRLPQIVGTSRALDMILTGRRVYADEAHTMGLCNRLVPAADREAGSSLESETQRLESLDAGIALANQVAAGGPAAVRAALGVLHGAHDALENAAYEVVLSTQDRNEALQAFLEKRGPVFQGR
ncbi:ClpP/crotonase [Cryphonectria parasitica EP155]|uniref:ClpP/crotonase n=1 Tax=Cryphonectria parasitica (strain ATCC 38755 / EP155) TaxID=660469 RepID=A0A9P4Y2H7_CRYP1|nr:ClpP/crotonase [Cryphonectria parasitica EP155]KAF3765284.1 ClpP/crotonase [Cryphonectria parasitica EP155]